MADIFDELVGTGASPAELVAQLRKRRDLGQTMALSGDKRIAGVGGVTAADAMGSAVDLRDRADKEAGRKQQQDFSLQQQEMAKSDRAEQRAYQYAALKQARDLAEGQQSNAREIARLKGSAVERMASSPFDKARQQQIAKDSVDWDSSGKVQTQAALDDIQTAISHLSADKDIGKSKTSMLPQWARSWTDPKGLEVQRLANRVTVANLRNTFGAQFTQAEGDQYKALDYDPALSNAQNMTNLRKKQAIIESNIRRKNELFGQYRKDNMSDFQGQTMNTLSDDDILRAVLSEGQ